MNVIYKYPLPIKEKFILVLPQYANIIRVGDVDGSFWLWAIVNTDAPLVVRHFECYKTGQPIETELRWLQPLGTLKLFIMQELCLYVFENLNPELCVTMENSQSKSEPTM